MASGPKAGKISAEKLCDLTGFTDRRHRQLAQEGYFPPPVRGNYQEIATLKGMFRYFRDQIQGAGVGRASLNSERLRKLKEEADRIALENDKTRGTLVEVEAVYRHFEAVFVSLRQKILGSGLIDQEKDEVLNDLRRLKARGL